MFLDILESTATRRDAKSYLARFGKNERSRLHRTLSLPSGGHGVNLGTLYKLSDHIKPPLLDTAPLQGGEKTEATTVHLALVKMRSLWSIDDEAISGVGRTLSQLAKLGMLSVVVMDQEADQHVVGHLEVQSINHQANRIVEAIQNNGDCRAQIVDQIIHATHVPRNDSSSGTLNDSVRIGNHKWLYGPLTRGIIPVIPCFGVDVQSDHRIVTIEANDIILELTRTFSDIQPYQSSDTKGGEAFEGWNSSQCHISLDRVILLEPFGGIPSADRSHGPHVYINMEQEYCGIKADLGNLSGLPEKSLPGEAISAHSKNLDLLETVLSILPPTSSGLIITPQEVARSEYHTIEHSTGPRVRTRRQRNPLIHNLLTDKPATSSSLPYNRSSRTTPGALSSTFVKRGMPVTIIPDPQTLPWAPPTSSVAPFTLSDPRIDLARLVNLMEASFRRKLNVDHYLARLQNRTAGVVVAGEYDGCAVFTWETPPGSPHAIIPYLDKFSVLPQWQGTGVGVADILFKAMVKNCFPGGVCWRSRADNTVNKWYFERAKGTWKIDGTKWTSFWTTENPSIEDLAAYEGVCRAVEPSWAD